MSCTIHLKIASKKGMNFAFSFSWVHSISPLYAVLSATMLSSSSSITLNYKTHSQQKGFSLKISRRKVGLASLILGGECIFRTEKSANAFEFEFGLVAPGQTVEEAQNGVKGHAQDLLQVRELLESGLWKAAQKALRQSSALLKKDIYIIIQNKPGSERPQLRKLYSTLFNNVTRLDYAARDKDGPEVWQRYENIVVAVNDILSRI